MKRLVRLLRALECLSKQPVPFLSEQEVRESLARCVFLASSPRPLERILSDPLNSPALGLEEEVSLLAGAAWLLGFRRLGRRLRALAGHR